MAAELIKSVLAAEAKGRSMEADAKKKADDLLLNILPKSIFLI